MDIQHAAPARMQLIDIVIHGALPARDRGNSAGAGDDVVIRATGSSRRIEIERADDLIERFAGTLPAGSYPPGYLDDLRDEWRR